MLHANKPFRLCLLSLCLLRGSAGVASAQETPAGGQYLTNLTPLGRPQLMTQACVLHKETYSHSLALPNGVIEYPVPGGMERFVTVVGIADGFRNARASATFTVEGVLPSGATKILDAPHVLTIGAVEKVDVPVGDLRSLRLRVRCAGFTSEEIRAVPAWWGEPRFVREGETTGDRMLPDLTSELTELAARFTPAQAQVTKPTAAVAPFDLIPGSGDGLAPVNAFNVCADFQIALINTKMYRVTAQGEQLAKLMEQNNFQLGSNYNRATRAELGNLLGAKNLVLGEIADRDQDGYVLTASLVDLESGLYQYDEQLVVPAAKNPRAARPKRTIAALPTGGSASGSHSLTEAFNNFKHALDPHYRGRNSGPSLPATGGTLASPAAPSLLSFLRPNMATIAGQLQAEVTADNDFAREKPGKPVVAIATFKLVAAPNTPLASANARNATTDFRVALHHTGDFRIAVTGTSLDKILERQNVEIGHEFDRATRAELGEQTAAKYLIVGEIADQTHGSYAVRVYVHDLASGEIRMAKKIVVNERKR